MVCRSCAARLDVHVAPSQELAPTPPMGWNSWDSYDAMIDEAQFRASAAWMDANGRYIPAPRANFALV
jgi:hypothetical protein